MVTQYLYYQRPNRPAPAVIRMTLKWFLNISSWSAINNVSFPGHGLTSETTQRFRGQPTVSLYRRDFSFANPGDLHTRINIAKAAGYTIPQVFIK